MSVRNPPEHGLGSGDGNQHSDRCRGHRTPSESVQQPTSMVDSDEHIRTAPEIGSGCPEVHRAATPSACAPVGCEPVRQAMASVHPRSRHRKHPNRTPGKRALGTRPHLRRRCPPSRRPCSLRVEGPLSANDPVTVPTSTRHPANPGSWAGERCRACVRRHIEAIAALRGRRLRRTCLGRKRSSRRPAQGCASSRRIRHSDGAGPRVAAAFRRKEKRSRLREGSPQAHHGGGRPRVGVVLHVDDLAVP